MIQNNPPRIVSLLTNPKAQVIFAILALCLIMVFGSSIFYLLPYDGAEIDFDSHEIVVIDKDGPLEKAGAVLGDLIIRINGKSVDKWGRYPSYPAGVRQGDILEYEIHRGAQILNLHVAVDSIWQHPGFLSVLIGLLLLSVAFWILGILLCLFVPADDVRARLVGLLWLLIGIVVAAGGPGSAANFWGARTTFTVAVCLLAFIGVTAHLYFPLPAFSMASRKWIISILAAVSFSFALLSVANDLVLDGALNSSIGLYTIIDVFLLVTMAVIVGLLFRSRFLVKELNIRRQTNIVLWGTVLSFAPFFIFTLLPIILFGYGHEYLDGSYSVLFLIFLPIAYAYAIQQRKLLKIDFIINRLVVFFVLAMLVLLVSFATLGIVAFIFNLPTQMPLFGGLMTTIMVLPAVTLQNKVQARVNQVLYGSHYDHIIVTSNLSSRLAQTLDRTNLTTLLTDGLAQQMGIQQTALLLAEGDHLELQASTEPFSVPLKDDMCLFLLDSQMPVRAQHLWALLSSPTQTLWQQFLWGQLFTPIILENQLHGLLILGDRTAGEIYSNMDVKIIAAVAQQAALAADNVHLVEMLRGLTRQIVLAGEAHRKQVARELHDVVLQDLYFLQQKLAPENVALAAHLDNTIELLRHTIKAQRPSLLDRGLEMALAGLVDDMSMVARTNGPAITWQAHVNQFQLPDEVATSIYRIAQEAILNAIKHARANQIQVSLDQKDGTLMLCVQDDGKGMTDGQTQSEHYGLTGMKERAMMIGAKISIDSEPDGGTRMTLETKL
jgi:signal transduction histidine kinase